MSASEYVLLASVFYLRQEDGSRKRYREGDLVTGLNDEQVHRLLRAKAIARPADVPAPDEPKPTEPADGKPADDATKAELIDWLVENAVDESGGDYTPSKLQPLNKAALWGLINSVED